MTKKQNRLVYSTRDDALLDHKKDSKTLAKSLPPQQQIIRVMIDRKRRRGKTVTVCQGFQLCPADLKQLEKTLKQYCGAGGTSSGDEIEIQGEQRDKIIEKLINLNYKAKAAGGQGLAGVNDRKQKNEQWSIVRSASKIQIPYLMPKAWPLNHWAATVALGGYFFN